MNERPITLEPTQPSSATLIRVLGLVALISGLLIVLVYQWTLPTITQQRQHALEEAVLKVIPGASRIEAWVVTSEGIHKTDGTRAGGRQMYAGFDATGAFQGLAAEAAAQGYADTVRLLYGYLPACECITGIRVIASRETPGFGDKLDSDAQFLENFKALDARLNEARNGLAHAIVTVKHGNKTQPWQIDAISGATVSSKAVGKALNDSAQQVLPAVAQRLDEIQEGR